MIEPRLASCRCSCAKDFAIYLITAKMTPLHSELVHQHLVTLAKALVFISLVHSMRNRYTGQNVN